jgi:hypothetical protein
MPRRRRVLAAFAVLLSGWWCLVFLGPAPLAAADPPSVEPAGEVVALRGRVVCLDALAATPADPAIDPCSQPGARFELRTSGGEAVRFLSGDARAEIFTDPQVRERDLEVHGWKRPDDTFEVLSVYSIVGGVLRHLHYRCDVCNITASAPGPCWCCGKPFELREEPVATGTGTEHEHAARDPR